MNSLTAKDVTTSIWKMQKAPFQGGIFNRSHLFMMSLLSLSFIQGLNAIYHQSYIGQDFVAHLQHVTDFPLYLEKGWDHSWTNPPTLYFLAYIIRTYFTESYFLEATMVVLMTMNLLALGLLFHFLEKVFQSKWLLYSLFSILVFAPFRTSTGIVFSADSLTLLPFVLLISLTTRIFHRKRNEDSTKFHWDWIAVGFALTLGIFCKYLFVGVTGFCGLLWIDQFIKLKGLKFRTHVMKTAIIALAIPTLLFGYHVYKNRQYKNVPTQHQFRRVFSSAELTWVDLLLLKPNDIQLLSAPQYSEDDRDSKSILVNHRYSYFSLLHLASYTDILDLFQKVPSSRSLQATPRALTEFARTRTPLGQFLNQVSVSMALPLSLLAFLGTVSALYGLIVKRSKESRQLAIPLLMGLGFYFPIFFLLPFVANAYVWGYWLPRLVAPSLIVFLILGFSFLDRQSQGHKKEMILYATGTYCGFLSVLWFFMLWAT